MVSSAWSAAQEISTFGKSLSQKQWLGHKAVLGSDQDSDQDTTVASDSTDSSAWVIRLEQCYAVTALMALPDSWASSSAENCSLQRGRHQRV